MPPRRTTAPSACSGAGSSSAGAVAARRSRATWRATAVSSGSAPSISPCSARCRRCWIRSARSCAWSTTTRRSTTSTTRRGAACSSAGRCWSRARRNTATSRAAVLPEPVGRSRRRGQRPSRAATASTRSRCQPKGAWPCTALKYAPKSASWSGRSSIAAVTDGCQQPTSEVPAGAEQQGAGDGTGEDDPGVHARASRPGSRPVCREAPHGSRSVQQRCPAHVDLDGPREAGALTRERDRLLGRRSRAGCDRRIPARELAREPVQRDRAGGEPRRRGPRPTGTRGCRRRADPEDRHQQPPPTAGRAELEASPVTSPPGERADHDVPLVEADVPRQGERDGAHVPVGLRVPYPRQRHDGQVRPVGRRPRGAGT